MVGSGSLHVLRRLGKNRILTQRQITAIAAYHGRLSYQRMLLHWFLCFWGNMAGALFVMAVILGCESGQPKRSC